MFKQDTLIMTASQEKKPSTLIIKSISFDLFNMSKHIKIFHMNADLGCLLCSIYDYKFFDPLIAECLLWISSLNRTDLLLNCKLYNQYIYADVKKGKFNKFYQNNINNIPDLHESGTYIYIIDISAYVMDDKIEYYIFTDNKGNIFKCREVSSQMSKIVGLISQVINNSSPLLMSTDFIYNP